jgi:mannose/cellobiose epimerase-like protein (N-acyl-D-glucosamine 2-epimerase family)
MTEADYTFASAQLDNFREKHCEGVSRICAAFMRGVHRDWSKKYPKRKLRFVEGMGTMFWTIDGRQVHCYTLARRRGVCYLTISHPRLTRMLKPLEDAIQWYCEYSDYRVAVAIGDIE